MTDPVVNAQIDNLVAASARGGTPAQTAATADVLNAIRDAAPASVDIPSMAGHQQDVGGMEYHSESGQIKIHGRLPPPSARIRDNGLDLDVAVQQVNANVSRLQSQLAAVHYDPVTGQPLNDVTGTARESLQRQLELAKRAEGYDLSRLKAIADQRANDAARSHAELVEQAAIAAVTRGDPKRAQVLKEELERAELSRVAESIIKARGAR